MDDMNMEGIWKEGEQIAKEMEEYCVEYQKKICPKCTKEQQAKRKGRIYPLSGCHCDHMMNARTKKFMNRVDGFMWKLLRNKTDTSPLSICPRCHNTKLNCICNKTNIGK